MFCNDCKVSKQKQKFLEKFEGKKTSKNLSKEDYFPLPIGQDIFFQCNGVPVAHINK